MGIICILLGIITFFCFTGLGAILSGPICNLKTILAMTFTNLRSVSDTTVTVAVVVIFAVIGLLIGMNLVMHGLTYNKINKVLNLSKRR